ncbi:MAG: hypothetical protein JXP73_07030 [Deltaproteobacteria bacterium]|nr:hypothetical protein [Deltaproteobacteria bacterium]
MGMFVLKLLVAPSLVATATLVARRFGPVVGGWVVGFPIVAGPILLFFAIEQGSDFAAGAARSTLLGLVSLASFSLAYAWVALRRRWVASLLLGWCAFALLTWLLRHLAAPAVVGLAAALVALRAALALLPRLALVREPPIPGSWDIPVRMLATAALVLSLTWAAGALGPERSGLLAPFPVASTVLVVFAHHAGGAAAAVRVLRGLLLGLQSFSVFCLLLSLLLVPTGIAAAFSTALVASVAVQVLVLRFAKRGSP